MIERNLGAIRIEHGVTHPEDHFGGTLGVNPVLPVDAVERRHQLQRGVEAKHGLLVALSRRSRDVGAETLRDEQQPDLRRITRGRFAARVDCRRRATRQRVGDGGRRTRFGRQSRTISFEVEHCTRGPHLDRAHAVLGERSGLVRADHGGRTERLHGAQPLDECAMARK